MDLISLSVREAARRIADGAIGAEDIVRAYLDRIAEREPVVRAWDVVDHDRAITAARALDRGTMRGALHGVPVGVKDVIDTVDMPTAYGSPIYRGHQPKADAACVALMKEAGAIALGKTVTAEFATLFPGKTANPHNPDFTPGGSSSGSAAAVAAGMVPLAFGTQTAGSIIRPASFCGVVGYKPSYGTISRVGVKMISDLLDTVGVFARTVDDAAFFVSVLATRPKLAAADAAGTPTVGLYRTPEWDRAEPGTEKAMDVAVKALIRSGAKVRELPIPEGFRGLAEAQLVIMNFELARCLTHERLRHKDQLSPILRELLDAGLATPIEEYDRARALGATARARLDQLFDGCDALLVPSAPGEAPRGLHATGDPVFNRAWTLLHVPCITVPVTHGENGLPVGAQLVGRIGDDARTLWTASCLERALKM